MVTKLLKIEDISSDIHKKKFGLSKKDIEVVAKALDISGAHAQTIKELKKRMLSGEPIGKTLLYLYSTSQ